MKNSKTVLFNSLILLITILFTPTSQNTFADFDTAEFVKNIDLLFDGENLKLDKESVVYALLFVYGEGQRKDIKVIEEKRKNDEALTEAEEEKLFLKTHIEEFIDENYKEMPFDVDKVKEIIRQSEFLIFLEDKMKEEEYQLFHEEGGDIDDGHIPDYNEEEIFEEFDSPDLNDSMIEFEDDEIA